MAGGECSDTFYNEFGYAPPVSVYESAFAQAKVSVCHVQAPPIPPQIIGVQGTAALYELADGIRATITNNHVLPLTDSAFLSRTAFTFERFGRVTFGDADIRICTTDAELDATVIELTDECVKRLQQMGANFIRLATARAGDRIAMAQFPDGVFSFDKGAVHEIKNSEIYYYLGCAPSSSGSPILLWEFTAIGIHKQSATSSEHRALGPVRRGTSLLAIAGFHLKATR